LLHRYDYAGDFDTHLLQKPNGSDRCGAGGNRVVDERDAPAFDQG
jgi:hypothetical protein